MGIIPSKIVRTVKLFNIENRTNRILSKPKPVPAPKHEKTIQEMERLKQENPSLEKELSKFDPQLHERLKQIYVSSTDVEPEHKGSRKLQPLSHKVRRTGDFGFDEDDAPVKGRILLKDCVYMLLAYAQNKGTIEELALKYGISYNDAKNIIKYFHIFYLVAPPSDDFKVHIGRFLLGREDGTFLSAKEFVDSQMPKVPPPSSSSAEVPSIPDGLSNKDKPDTKVVEEKSSSTEK